MTGPRCHCGCRRLLERCGVRSHARYASKSCRTRIGKQRSRKALTSQSQSQTRAVREWSLTTAPHSYAYVLAPATSTPTGWRRTLHQPSCFPTTAFVIEVQTAGSRAKGCFMKPTGEEEPESHARQFVRWAYGDDCQLPYRPASQEPKPKVGPMPPINRVLGALHSAGCEYRPAQSDRDSWQALCPTHQDTRPSLQVTRNADGMVWLKCWAGCSKEGILAALGLSWRDLWEASERDHGRRRPFVKPLLPAHLRQAMERLLREDDERRAA